MGKKIGEMFPYFPLISLNVRLAVVLFFQNYKAVAGRDDFIFFDFEVFGDNLFYIRLR